MATVTVLMGCGGDSAAPASPLPQPQPQVPTGPAPVATVALSSSSLSLVKGATQQLTATTRDAAGNTLTGRTVTWASSDTAKARVDANGLVAGLAVGTATVTATSEGKSATAAITITAAPNANIDRTSSYAIAVANAKASLIDWTNVAPGRILLARGAVDLDGDGVADAVVAPYQYPSQTSTDAVQFLKGTRAGSSTTLTNVTSSWLQGSATSPVHGRKLLFGDYNGDGVKDVFICAHGYDAPPFPGTTNVLLLSKGPTTWAVSTQSWSGYIGYHHGCASADIDNDGDEDIFVTDSKTTSYFLINDGKGNFTQSRTGLPASLSQTVPVFVTEMFDIDRDGFVDMVVGGDETYTTGRVYWGDGSGTFSDARSTLIPKIGGWQNLLMFGAGDVDGDGKAELVIGRVPGASTDPNFYHGYRIQVLKMSGRDFTEISAATATTVNASAPTVILDYTGAPFWIEWVWLADYDGDGRPDLIGSDAYNGRFLARNTGAGFSAWTKLP